MKYWTSIVRITCLEVVQSRLFQILVAATLFAPAFGFALSSLFMVDIGKVFIDGVVAVTHVLSIFFIVFISAGMLARDIEQKVCYLLVIEPSNRTIYILGRFGGLLAVFFLMLALVILESVLIGHFYIENKIEFYQSNYAWQHVALLIFLHAFQYIAILGFVFFIFSWATGTVEIMIFSFVGLMLTWIFPPILSVLANQDVMVETPMQIRDTLLFIYNFLPHLDGGVIALNLAHGKTLDTYDIMLYVFEHIGYAGIMLVAANYIFSKRDL